MQERYRRYGYTKLDDSVSYEEKAKNYLEQIQDKVTERMIGLKKYYVKNGEIVKPMEMGQCYRIWNIQKSLLKEIFDFDLKTPAEEHPEMEYD